jgi:3-hydroxybutyryl-CoA dehydratase
MKFDDFVIGYKGSLARKVTREYNNQFAEISGDFNPIHFDDAVGRKFGFKSAISNGFVTESRVAGALVETFGSEKTVVVALEKNTRFLAPV